MRVRQSHLIHTPTTIFNYTHHSKPFRITPSSTTHKPKKKTQSTTTSPESLLCDHSLYQLAMAAMNCRVLTCNYAISGIGSSDLSSKLASMPSGSSLVVAGPKLPVIRSQQGRVSDSKGSLSGSGASEGRRAALLCLAAALFTTAASTSTANAGVIEEYLEKSKANKELNDKKRLATSGANFARAFTVQFGTCKFPQNFTGCQDLAKQKKVPFLSDDLDLECEGKDKFKCGSNVFWKW
ncbi:hypothetical protein F0562_018383 [Nyssa sinensis]|uniref:Photosystem I reaction center subunit N, chloroplastic n=1 Tax=Nyssa sinensis TaxID=561372 RepID=A0A5J4ZBV5_9ASTE|nr:hypothetical protein F0562_018383 [Nyssa sinensis]